MVIVPAGEAAGATAASKLSCTVLLMNSRSGRKAYQRPTPTATAATASAVLRVVMTISSVSWFDQSSGASADAICAWRLEVRRPRNGSRQGGGWRAGADARRTLGAEVTG